MPCLLGNHGDHNVFVWFVRCFWNSWSASIKVRRKGAFMRGWKMCRRGDRRSVFRLPPPPALKRNVYVRVLIRKHSSCVQIIHQSIFNWGNWALRVQECILGWSTCWLPGKPAQSIDQLDTLSFILVTTARLSNTSLKICLTGDFFLSSSFINSSLIVFSHDTDHQEAAGNRLKCSAGGFVLERYSLKRS